MSGARDPIWDEPLSPAEFLARERAAVASVTGEEAERMREHMEWFCRRYPTPLDRLRYVRRHMARMLVAPRPT